MMNVLLDTIVRTRCRYAIVDMTGVNTIDARTADHVVKLIQAQTRASDSIALFHDRLAAILPHTDAAGAHAFAERIREQVRRETFRVGGKEIRFTVSIGLSTFVERTTIFYDSILKTAESALAAATAAGGDRLEVAVPGPAPGPATS